MKEIKDLTLQEVQEILEKEAERGKSFTDENLRYLNEIVITKEMNRFKGIITFLEDCKKYDMMRIKDGIEPVVFTENIKEKDDWIPCKVGDIIWDNDFGFPESYVVTGFSLGIVSENEDDNELESSGEILIYFRDNFGTTGRFPASELGNTVFLTEQEAEEALRKEQ